MNEQPALTPLFNRAADGTFKLPEDGWFHLVPKGRFPIAGPEGPMVQVIDDRAVERMLNRFAEEAKAPNFPGILIDYDHFSYDLDKSSVAAGWVRELKNRENGIWGRIEWTPKGQQSLKDGEYRFVSPVWDGRDVEVLAGRANKEVRPVRVETFGLVNKPNLRGMVPLSNRDLSGREVPATDGPEKKQMKQVSAKLGLQPDASEEAVLAAVTKFMNRAAEADGFETKVKTLEKENEGLKTGQVEAALEKYRNRFKPEKREAWKNRLSADYAGAVELLEEMTPIGGGANGAPGGRALPGKMLNRAEASTPGSRGAEDGTNLNATQRAAKIENLAGEYKMKNRCSTREAYDAVERSNPELFAKEEAAAGE